MGGSDQTCAEQTNSGQGRRRPPGAFATVSPGLIDNNCINLLMAAVVGAIFSLEVAVIVRRHFKAALPTKPPPHPATNGRHVFILQLLPCICDQFLIRLFLLIEFNFLSFRN